MSDTMHNSPPPQAALARVMRLTGYLLLAALGLLALFALGARYRWYFELVPNFQLVYLWLALLALGLLAMTRSRVGVVVALGFVAFHGLQIAPYVPLGGAAYADSDRVRVMLANVLTVNRDFDAFAGVVSEQEPDLLCVQEVDAAWQGLLEELRDTYPYQHIVARPDNFGIALVSRWPLRDIEVRELGGVTVPVILATVDTPHGPMRLLDLHTIPPMFTHMAAGRNRQLAEAAVLARTSELPFVLAGDLNTTPWSPYFRDLLEDSGLKNSRLGRGPMPTWPVGAGNPALIPIDHVLVSEDITVLGLHRGGATGSDHLPIVADIRLPGGAV